MITAAVVIACFVCSLIGTSMLRAYAIKAGLMDVPNERSSHSVPTPRSGGAALLIATSAGILMLAAVGIVDSRLCAALVGGGVAVGLVGFLDDKKQLSAPIRLGVHLTAAVWALAWMGGLPPIRFGDYVLTSGFVGYALGILAIGWTVNLFNFMDGIDGIAGSEAVCIVSGGALLAVIAGGSSPVIPVCLVFCAACLGFLVLNWPPAKIFLGDVGSGYLGYVIAVLALAGADEEGVAPLTWLILGGLFFTDATVTLVRRLRRGERPYQPHRTHLYQILSRRWGSHRRVTVSAIAVNVGWLLPIALLAQRYPYMAGWLLLLALSPIAVVTLVVNERTAARGRDVT